MELKKPILIGIFVILGCILITSNTVATQYVWSELSWEYNAGSQISSGIVVGSDGVIYFGDRYDGIFALNSDGTLKWKYSSIGARVDSGGALSNDESIVYFGGDNSEIYAIYTATGVAKWVYDASPTSYLYSGIVVDSADNVYFGLGDSRAMSVTYGGVLRWSHNKSDILPDADENYAGMLIVGNYVYAATYDGLFKYALADGAEQWQHPSLVIAQGTGISVGIDGNIYYGRSGHFYAINQSTGVEEWNFTLANYACTANVVGSDGNIWFVDCDGATTKLYVLNYSTGAEVWHYDIPDWVGSGVSGSTGLALDSNDNAYIGCDDDNLYVIDSSGSLLWTFTAGNDIQSGIAFSPSEDTVYFGSDDGYLYAITTHRFDPSHGIYGNVYLLPLYSEGRDTDITCSNDTFNTSTTANTTGYYIFDNLATGFYWINATLHSYFDNNALVEVVSGYNQTLLSGCDAL